MPGSMEAVGASSSLTAIDWDQFIPGTKLACSDSACGFSPESHYDVCRVTSQFSPDTQLDTIPDSEKIQTGNTTHTNTLEVRINRVVEQTIFFSAQFVPTNNAASSDIISGFAFRGSMLALLPPNYLESLLLSVLTVAAPTLLHELCRVIGEYTLPSKRTLTEESIRRTIRAVAGGQASNPFGLVLPYNIHSSAAILATILQPRKMYVEPYREDQSRSMYTMMFHGHVAEAAASGKLMVNPESADMGIGASVLDTAVALRVTPSLSVLTPLDASSASASGGAPA